MLLIIYMDAILCFLPLFKGPLLENTKSKACKIKLYDDKCIITMYEDVIFTILILVLGFHYLMR